jgi:hypothetical protein
MGVIIPRTSPLDPDVRVSVHPAPDVLSFCFCSCASNHDSFHGLLLDYFLTSWHGFRLYDEDGFVHQLEILNRRLHKYGFAVLRL